MFACSNSSKRAAVVSPCMSRMLIRVFQSLSFQVTHSACCCAVQAEIVELKAELLHAQSEAAASASAALRARMAKLRQSAEARGRGATPPGSARQSTDTPPVITQSMAAASVEGLGSQSSAEAFRSVSPPAGQASNQQPQEASTAAALPASREASPVGRSAASQHAPSVPAAAAVKPPLAQVPPSQQQDESSAGMSQHEPSIPASSPVLAALSAKLPTDTFNTAKPWQAEQVHEGIDSAAVPQEQLPEASSSSRQRVAVAVDAFPPDSSSPSRCVMQYVVVSVAAAWAIESCSSGSLPAWLALQYDH